MTFVARIMNENHAPSIVFKMRMCLWTSDTRLLTEGNFQTMPK